MKKFLTGFAVMATVFALMVVTQGSRKRAEKEPEVKNIILMVGDGMGLAHVTALMLDNGYEDPTSIDRATVTGLIKTYSLNNRVTDSGASATAYATGHKTYNSRLSVDTLGNPLPTIIEKAEAKGMSTGLVATVALQHATPGAFFAHSVNRANYYDIALGMLDTSMDIAIGGGRDFMEDRADSLNITAELRSRGYTIADNLEGLDGVTGGKAMAIYPGKVSGFPTIHNGRDPEYLPKATAKALEVLSNNSRGKGFFLMVEGSLIDGISHDNNARNMLAEMRDFDNTVGVAMDYADSHPGTLVIVLADHETGGLSIPSGNVDFLRAESGIDFKWGTTGHSGTMVPLYAYGPGALQFTGILENNEVGRRMQMLLGLE